MHVIFVVSAPTACYSRCERANRMLLCVLSASASPCIMLLWSPSRQNACLMLLSSLASTSYIAHAIVVGHRIYDTIASCTEFMQKIHHDDDADARHYWRIEASSSPAIGPRAATTAPRPRSGCCGCPHRGELSKCRRRQHLSRGVNGSFFRVPSLSRCICRHGVLRAVNACCCWRTRQ